MVELQVVLVASETAFAQRQAQYDVAILAQCGGSRRVPAPYRMGSRFGGYRCVLSQAVRTCLNFLGEEGEDYRSKPRSVPTTTRLIAVKKKYDPKNFFCLEPEHQTRRKKRSLRTNSYGTFRLVCNLVADH